MFRSGPKFFGPFRTLVFGSMLHKFTDSFIIDDRKITNNYMFDVFVNLMLGILTVVSQLLIKLFKYPFVTPKFLPRLDPYTVHVRYCGCH